MNKRLGAEYSSIKEQNRQNFLENKISISETWGKPIWGVTLQIDLTDQVSSTLCEYQSELAQLEPRSFLFPPRQCQHISLNQVVYWNGHYAFGPEETWRSIAHRFLPALGALNLVFSSFDVSFSQLIATTAGIIWVAFDQNDEMERLRNEVLQRLPVPQETTLRNHIIHTTVARFKGKLDSPEAILRYLQGKTEAVSMKVGRIILRKELVFPSLKTGEIAAMDLV